ncbi:MAG TPA: flagellar hook assembly protein FlgD [Rhodospirillales bacterium]|jgi:flagellar basal-body rod modification protein FlgD
MTITTPATINPGAPQTSQATTSSSLLGASSNTNTASSQLSANFDNFLKLLTTQLANQDPLSPLDATQFTTQLAQFSGVEQAINTNKKLDALIAAQTTGQLTSGVSYLGKFVEAKGNISTLQNGQAEWGYFLSSQAASTQIAIYNDQGQLVRQIPGETTAGAHQLVWDGKDNGGNSVPDGNYQIQLVAVDNSGSPVTATTNFVSTVTGVLTSNGQVMLQTADGPIALSNVISVREPPPPAS